MGKKENSGELIVVDAKRYRKVKKALAASKAGGPAAPAGPDKKESTRELVVVDVTRYRKIKKALAESEERYRLLFENVPIGIYRTTPDGRIVDSNPALVKMLGYDSFADLAKRNLEKEYSNVGRLRSDFIKRLNRDGEIRGLEQVWKRKDGSPIYIRENAKLVRDDDGQVFFEGTVEDITQLKLNEEAQRLRTQQMEILNHIISRGNLAESLQELLEIILDSAIQPLDFDMAAIFMLDPEARRGKLMAQRGMPTRYKFNEQYLSIDHEPFSVVLQKGQPYFIDDTRRNHPYYFKKWGWRMASSVPLVSKGRVVGALNMASCRREFFRAEEKAILELIGKEAGTLISKLQTEAALRESERYYRSLIDTSPDVISVMDLEARLTTVNQQFLKSGGYFYDEVLGRSVFEFIGPAEADAAQRKIDDFVKSNKISGSEYSFKKKDGAIVPMDVSGSIIHDGEDKPIGIIAIGRDVSERKGIETALRESEKYYRALIDTSPDVIAVTDLEGNLQTVNQSFAALSGYPLEEIIGRSSFDFVADQERERFFAGIQEFIRSGTPLRIEYAFKKRDGGTVPLELWGSLLRDIEGRPRALIGFARDISQRRRAEEQLRFMSSVTENTSDAIMVTDTDFRITYINKVAEQFFGYSLDELKGRTPDMFNAEPDAALIQKELYENVAAGRTYLGESLNRRKDGSTFTCEYKVTPLMDDKGRIYAYSSIQRDVSERKRSEAGLRQSEETFRRTFQAIPDPAYIWTRLPDGRFVLTNANEAAERVTNGGIKKFIGIESKKLFGPDSEFVHNIRQSMEKGEVLRDTEVLYAYQTTGESRWLLVDYVPTAADKLLVITRDISERREAEAEKEAALRALRQSENKYRELVENLNDVVFAVDPSGKISYISPTISRIAGYSAEEVTGKNLFDYIGPEDREHYGAQMQQTVATGSSIGEFMLTAKDKSRKWVRASSKCVVEKGAIVGIRGVMSDISERKEAEAKLLAYQEQLRALSSELTLIEERERRRIASELHDQIGQNLALCKLKITALEKEPAAEPLRSELSAVRRLVEVSIQDARSLIFDLSPPVLYELGLPAALEWLAERIGEQFQVPVEFENRAVDEIPESDRQVIVFQVVRELLVNMGKHSRADQAKVILSLEGQEMRIQVNDDGVGFDATRSEEPRAQDGGFGFFSMRERLNYLGGRLEVRSRPGQGSQITLTVPLGPPAAPAAKEQP